VEKAAQLLATCSKLSQSAREGPLNSARDEEQVRAYYYALRSAFGPQHWWPARTRFEVIIGAYLTQNTSWTNVEIALRRLRNAHVLMLAGIRDMSLSELESLIRSSGYFRQKAARLKTFVAFLDKRYGGSLSRMFSQPTEKLRQELLELNGVGPETADSILLYAGQHPVFVVDTYTRRILERHGIVSAKASYEEIRTLFERSLGGVMARPPVVSAPEFPASFDTHSVDIDAKKSPKPHLPSAMSLAKRSSLAQIYNDMHGLIVSVGKNYCLKSRAICEECPLQQFLPRGAPLNIQNASTQR
jgi:endonuclease-3 related protein